MNKLGSRNIPQVLRAILAVGNGERISHLELLAASGIATTNTVAKAVREAEQNGLLIVEKGKGATANRYEVPASVRAIL